MDDDVIAGSTWVDGLGSIQWKARQHFRSDGQPTRMEIVWVEGRTGTPAPTLMMRIIEVDDRF